MKFCAVLVGPVRLELNHIYTEKPFPTPSGDDMGWFCREHALQVGALAEMFGHKAELCCGDIGLRIPGDITICTLGSGADHAWCRIDGEAPFDASVTLKYLAVTRQDVQIVCPNHPEHLSGFKLTYERGAPDDAFAQVLAPTIPMIAYNEKLTVPRRPTELLANPFAFLHPPPSGLPSFTDLYGEDVFFAITVHLYRVSRGEVKPMFRYCSPQDTIRAIVKRNPKARMVVTEAPGAGAI